MDLRDRVALITGGRRIGATIALELAARGADIALSYRRSLEQAAETAADVEKRGRRAFLKQVDLSQASDCQSIVDETVKTLGRLDILINMASVYVPVSFDELTDQVWDFNLAVDLRSAFLCSHAAVPHLRASGGGRIINFSDWIAASGRPRYKGYLTYYVAKGAVIALTEALALELAADNILVNAIAPGPVLAPEDMTEEQRRSVEEATPLGRWGGADEIARGVVALIENDFITGETLRIDGGRHIK